MTVRCTVCWLCVLWCFVVVFLFFFFKQKTAYEMRISDWSSDVCSSDLMAVRANKQNGTGLALVPRAVNPLYRDVVAATTPAQGIEQQFVEIGRASCRERVCQYV